MLYSYKCDNCGAEFDISATLEEKENNNPEKFRCPECESVEIKQQLTGGNFISSGGDIRGGCSGGCCGCGH